jgi:hypothetical protein
MEVLLKFLSDGDNAIFALVLVFILACAVVQTVKYIAYAIRGTPPPDDDDD